ncbi:uncharacterized protein LOC130670616 [Microplitis mediator]|uniref:uncharacterized protein LOC130670616 n=1 Tax=Microplitis mediator TaxID=375433 RepID=UPI002556C403|nr:uncharacterized protein LOC130670616 [Microplitis mediator]
MMLILNFLIVATEASAESLKILQCAKGDDWNSVKKAWEDAFVIRKQLKSDRQDKLVEFDIFPCMSDQRADELIHTDFEYQFGNAKSLRESWTALRSSLESFIASKRTDNFNLAESLQNLLELPDGSLKFYNFEYKIIFD